MLPMWFYALASVSLVSLISLVGVLTMTLSKRTVDKVIFYLVALATGAMLGNALVHIIPEAFKESQNLTLTSSLVLGGFLLSFLFEKVLNLRCHHAGGCHGTGHCNEGDEGCHDAPKSGHIHPTGYMALVSHGMDNFIDGVLIGVSYMVSIPAGMATTLAIILHEIPMEFGGFGVLVDSGFTRKRALLVNFGSALVAVAATVLTICLGESIHGFTEVVAPMAGGTILYITASGLIPKMQKVTDTRRSVLQFAIMVAGIAVMIAVKFLESGHTH